MKPANILVEIDGTCKVADFGASAELTKAAKGEELQAGGGAVAPSADVWAVGVTLLQVLTGAPPYDVSAFAGPHQLMAAIADGSATPLGRIPYETG
eukprot:gene7501-20094_t